jgi:hypothetical protein
MRVHGLFLAGALVAAAIPLSAGAALFPADRETGTSAWQAASATYTCPPGYIGSRMPMLRTANLGRRIARPVGE